MRCLGVSRRVVVVSSTRIGLHEPLRHNRRRAQQQKQWWFIRPLKADGKARTRLRSGVHICAAAAVENDDDNDALSVCLRLCAFYVKEALTLFVVAVEHNERYILYASSSCIYIHILSGIWVKPDELESVRHK